MSYPISRLDYFMAHAPAEPQRWFRPKMPPRPPVYRPPTLTREEQQQLFAWQELDTDIHEIESPTVRDVVRAIVENRKALDAWDKEAARETYLQWPKAWAIEVIARS